MAPCNNKHKMPLWHHVAYKSKAVGPTDLKRFGSLAYGIDICNESMMLIKSG